MGKRCCGSIWVILAGAGVLLASCADQRVPPPSTEIDETAFRTHVSVLASDDFEGRRPGTAGEDKTVAYLLEQFRKLGLKPGNGESFLQQVPMVEILAGADASLSIAGPKGAVTLANGRDVVMWTKRAVPQVHLAQSELVFVGYGIVAPEYAWNDYADIDVHGKTVVVLLDDPGYASKDPKLFKGGAMTPYGLWSYKVEEAARQGAAGVLLVHDAGAAGYGWTVVQNTWTGPQLELASVDGNAGRAAIEAWISNDAARALFTRAGLDFTESSAAAARVGFKPVPMGLRLEATLHNSLRPFVSANVIAVLPGGSRRRETVMYVAHWDHLGTDPSRSGHRIFHGAVDNATGVAGLLTVAQSFARTKPPADRSIVFLALTGGEFGQLGSQYYVANPIYPLRETAAVLDLDTLRIGGPTRDVMVFGFGNTDLEGTARSVALLQGRELGPDLIPELGLYYRSDSITFARASVPVLYAQGGLDDAARGPVWGRAQLDDYMAHRYRQPVDQYSTDWDVRGALDDLSLYYEVGNRIARSKRFPRWYPNSEYRVARNHPAPWASP
jgi:Zn-dependent M28 family amino/carboxypeptidase